MDAQRRARLEQEGINIAGALERFMGNEAMLERYLQKFLSEKSYIELQETVAAGDREGAARAVHTLKSICGTIGCEEMAELVIRQEQEMRAGNWNAAVAMMPQITAVYEKLCCALRA